MSQIFSAIAVIVFVAVFRGAIKRLPVAFYLIAGLVAALGIYFTYNPGPSGLVRAIIFAVQKGHIGFALLAVVMFVGVFDRSSAVRRALGPIRGELSIMGAILMLGHAVPYVANYLSMTGALLSLKPTVQASLCIAVVLLALLGVLAITSIKALRARMDARTWKRVQMLAYPFFLLIFLHLLGYLLVPLKAGSLGILVGLGFYGVVLILYLVLRARRFVLDGRVDSAEGCGCASAEADAFKEA